MSVADYSDGPIAASALLSAGVTGVVRYVTLGSSGKHITKSELTSLRAGGIEVALVAEQAARTLASSSWDGADKARSIAADCANLGYTGVVYQTVDWDIDDSEWPTVRANLREVIGVLGLSRTGLYGPYDALTWAGRDLGITLLWQTMSAAHSGRRNAKQHPKAVLWQRRKATVGRHTVDINDVLNPVWGQEGSTQGGDDMPQALTGTIPAGVAYDESGHLVDAANVVAIPVPDSTAGLFKGRRMWLGLANDWSTAATIRVGLYAGGKWTVSLAKLDGGKTRPSIALPSGTTKISLGRCRGVEASVPVGWVVEIG